MQTTVRQFGAMLDQAREQENRSDLRAGVIASVIANCWRDAKSQITPHDLFPNLPKPVEHETPPDVMIAMLEHFAGRCNKSV